MGRVSIVVALLLTASALVKIPVVPTIFPTISSKSSSSSSGDLDRKPLSSDITNIRNLQYKVKLYVGTPPQEFEMIVDTGSDWTWVPACQSTCHFPNHTYQALRSLTWKDLNAPLNIVYAAGSVYSSLGMETFSFDKMVNASNHAFLVVNAAENLDNLQADGVMGLSFQFPASKPFQTSLVQTFYEQGLIESPVFSIFLNNNEFGNKEAVPYSALILGGAQLDVYSLASEFDYIPCVIQEGYWAVAMHTIAIGEVEISLESTFAIIDSGTSYILAPSFDAYQILEVIKGVNTCTEGPDTYVCRCDYDEWAAFYPIIVLLLGPEQTKVRLNPEDYFYRSEGMCQLLIDSDPRLTFWILGDVFLRKYYIVFDMEKRVIGLAPSVLSVVPPQYGESWQSWMKVFSAPTIGSIIFLVAYIYLEKPCRSRPIGATISRL